MKKEILCFDCNGHGISKHSYSWPCNTCSCNGILQIDNRGIVLRGEKVLFIADFGRLRGYYDKETAKYQKQIIIPLIRSAIKSEEKIELSAWIAATAFTLLATVSIKIMISGALSCIIIATLAASRKSKLRMDVLKWNATTRN